MEEVNIAITNKSASFWLSAEQQGWTSHLPQHLLQIEPAIELVVEDHGNGLRIKAMEHLRPALRFCFVWHLLFASGEHFLEGVSGCQSRIHPSQPIVSIGKSNGRKT